jgi:hypothetical protein
MEAAINFYELKQQFEALGIKDAGLVNDLRAAIVSDKSWFSLDAIIATEKEEIQFQFDIHKNEHGRFSLETYDGVIISNTNESKPGTDHLRDQVFEPDVPVTEAILLLQTRLKHPDVSAAIAGTPMTRQEVANELQQNHLLNQKIMNEQNFDFLKDNLKYLGFEDKLNKDLEKQVKKQPAEFTLQTEIQHYSNKTEHTLHFKKSSETDMYFLNKQDATLRNGKPEEDKTQTFYVTKGHGITAKEAFNLLEGRSVYKELVNKEKEPYKAWLKIDFEAEKDKNNNHILTRYSNGYGFDLEKSLNRFPIKELADPEQNAALLKSLQKGNVQQVTIDSEGKAGKFYIEASPQYKTIKVYNEQRQAVKRETLLKPELKASKAKKNDQSEDQQQKKKRSRGPKM